MSVYRQQAHLEAPLDHVWGLVGTPTRYPEWWPRVIEVRGERFEEGEEWAQVTQDPGGSSVESNFLLERRAGLEGFFSGLDLFAAGIDSIELPLLGGAPFDGLAEDLRGIRMSCQLTGMYAEWLLTPAAGGTFVDLEMGMEPRRPEDSAFDEAEGKAYFRVWASQSLDALRSAVAMADPR